MHCREELFDNLGPYTNQHWALLNVGEIHDVPKNYNSSILKILNKIPYLIEFFFNFLEKKRMIEL